MSVVTSERQRMVPTVIELSPSEGFVCTLFLKEIVSRAMVYLRAGLPVHLRGPAGIGKTTLAFHLAALLQRPMMLIYGDDEFGSSDLVGGQYGYRRSQLRDNFIHSVLRVEEDVMQRWVDNRLTTACREGFTLVYDEFTRSRPEANNALLSVLEERMLAIPAPALYHGESYIQVHPLFRAIFTSNPEEYAGVHKVQDALLDRMVTIDLSSIDEETEIHIVRAKTGLELELAERIVRLVREFRALWPAAASVPTVRSAIMIGQIFQGQGVRAWVPDPFVVQACQDVLVGRVARNGDAQQAAAVLINLFEHAQRGGSNGDLQTTRQD